MTTEGTCQVEDAELHVRRGGDGPPLLFVPGGIGSADSLKSLASRLSSAYTVLVYDRRGHSRSTDRSAGSITVERQADDARAVIEHFGFGKALVFGTSAGAQIGLALAARHPEAVAGLVSHEPPAVRLLPDAQEWLDFADEQVALTREGKVFEAFKEFVASIAGAGLPDAKAVRLPNETEWQRLFCRELAEIYRYLPDVETLRRGGVPIVLAAGQGSRGYYHYRPARALALELGLPFVEMPGAHLAPQRSSAEFAAALTEILGELLT
ncbi:alpha/beta fold hydrolase [Amycolatopsis taiwanensis]|uniref:alpha/beta fold hydrolase n=1 Tax=Amycolatopsis taiwanensis TaxID=342230 RepID=UPI0004858855|nr:alpha/beta hydrolase [Amycolatopsis taiwanensis]